VSAVPAALAAAAVVAPLLVKLELPLAAFAVFAFFSRVCHQLPDRSFLLFGTPVAVCARCLGIYAGAAVGAWANARRAVLLRWVVAAAMANVVEALTEIVGLHGNLMLARFGLGAMLGGALAAVVAEAVKLPGDKIAEAIDGA
jgi:uncharacterized membrane protein